MKPAPTRTLITGGAGFIGSHLAARCLADGEEVHIMACPGTALQRVAGLGWDLAVHRVEMEDEAAVARCLAEVEPDRVYHLSSETRWRSYPDIEVAGRAHRVQLQVLTSLLKGLAGLSRSPAVMVRTGSIAEYGPGCEAAREDQREHPATPYGAAMLAGTHLCEMLQAGLSFPLITARLALIYGPGQSTGFLIPELIDHCLDGSADTVQRPEARRDLVFIDDAIDALRRIAAVRPSKSIINIASGTASTTRSIAQLIVEETGCDPQLIGFADRPEDSDWLYASPYRAARLLHWRARTSLSVGLARTVAARRAEREEENAAARSLS